MVVTTPVKVAAVSKVKAPKAKKPSAKPSHPPTSTLVNGAIRALKERSGSSLQAIKKYIASNNKVDADKLAPFIKKYLKNAVAGGKLVQTKGKGASGSFKLAALANPTKPKMENKSSSPNKSAAKKPTVKKSAEKKKKPTGSSKKPNVKPSKPATLKQKPTKQSKAVTKKTKTPKPKTSTKKLVTGSKK